MSENSHVLKSELAGVWYTDDSRRLAQEVGVYLDASEKTVKENVTALILPHAGYRYSGMVAAAGVKQLAGNTYSRVIVIGPSHRIAMADFCSIPDVDAIETPLGQIRIDRQAAERLRQHSFFTSIPLAHSSEHSVQIELPLLQQALGDFALLPIVCGDLSLNVVREIGQALLDVINEDTLVVISSDFTHYGHGFGYVPFEDDIPENLERLDLGAFRFIERHDLEGFMDYVGQTGATICGRSPISILLSMLSENQSVQLLKYNTSGRLTNDWSHCVSYLSAAVTGAWNESGAQKEYEASVLSESDKTALLQFARQRICEHVLDYAEPAELDVTPPMQELMGAFVTLHEQGQLRGCIGEIFPERPLHEAIREQAVNAALHDPRFPRVRADELGLIDIEISALTPPHPVASYAEIEIGRHGVVLRKGFRSAVFLPQVAPEQGWGLEETLSHLSMKAGLAPDAWKSDCEFHVFEAIVFSEKESRYSDE